MISLNRHISALPLYLYTPIVFVFQMQESLLSNIIFMHIHYSINSQGFCNLKTII